MEKTRILLCEDDESLGMLLREYLQAKDYNVTLAPDGEAGYQLFTNEKFDLCILDVMMPKKDGLYVLEEMKKVAYMDRDLGGNYTKLVLEALRQYLDTKQDLINYNLELS